MAKFNIVDKRGLRERATSPVAAEATPSGSTHEGGPGYARDAKGELFLLAVSNMVGEATFYETGKDRDSRFASLLGTVAVADPIWMLGFLGWLRGEANMRSAALVGAAEAVHARLAHAAPMHAVKLVPEGPRVGLEWVGNRQMVAAVLQRADEPGEMLAYWVARFGRKLPQPVKRGVADAVRRLYTEYGLLKYDTASHGFRFGDVLDLTHPAPVAPWQGDLFRYALDRRHGHDGKVPGSLNMVVCNAGLRAAVTHSPDVLLNAEALKVAGLTWEDALSLAGSKVDKAKLWAALIPSMGYMALLRNLRNFDEAGVSDEVAAAVSARLADPDQVARSRQFPFRFLSAFRAVTNLRWAHPLERALTASLDNVPGLPGRTLILVDRSPSMFPHYAHMHSQRVQEEMRKTGITLADRAALFGVAIALRCADATVVQYGQTSHPVQIPRGASVLPMLERFGQIGGTDTFAAARAHYAKHDRVVILTDEQTRPGWDPVPPQVPVYTWNLGGYQMGHTSSGVNGRHAFGGLTDAAFRMIPLLEAGQNAAWPWEGDGK